MSNSTSESLGLLAAILVRATRATRVLEIGAGHGRRTVEIAAALPASGRLIALERDAALAQQARSAIDTAGFSQRVTVIVGDAARYLHKLAGPFDVIVVDYASAAHDSLLDKLIRLLSPAGLLVTRTEDASADYNETRAADRRLRTICLQQPERIALSVRIDDGDPSLER